MRRAYPLAALLVFRRARVDAALGGLAHDVRAQSDAESQRAHAEQALAQCRARGGATDASEKSVAWRVAAGVHMCALYNDVARAVAREREAWARVSERAKQVAGCVADRDVVTGHKDAWSRDQRASREKAEEEGVLETWQAMR